MSRAVVFLALAVAGCGGGAGGRSIDVFAASSLTDAITEIAAGFEAADPNVDVRLNLAASSTLREQILEGAPADVFAAANETTMAAVVERDRVAAPPVAFARTRLVIAVPAGNPGAVTGLDDLDRSELLVGLCAPGVPCGDLAREVLARAGVDAAVDTDEPNARALTAKLADGELDVGLIYATDAMSMAGVTAIPIADRFDAVATYAIAPLAGSGDDAASFVAYVLSPAGRAILAEHGFELP